jgi:hypothetical protein
MAATGVAGADELKGCTAAQIAALERRYAVRLPATYRRFLEVMGRRSGRLFTHDWIYTDYRYVLGATAEVREQLAEGDDGFELPPDAVVILGREGEQYNFIRCDRPDDSRVWAIDLGASRVRARQFRASVFGWLRAWATEAAEAVASGWYNRKRGRA